MFNKNSRYRNLPQTQHVTARGEWILSVDLRFIPVVYGRFLHSVRDRERLDLLAFKYYSDPRRWWLIADANPETPFPIDLLDTRPLVEEELTLVHPGYLERTQKLSAILGTFGTVTPGALLVPSRLRVTKRDFFANTAIVVYAATTTRALIVDEIRRQGFRLIASFAWPQGASTAEAFTFEDEQAKKDWNDLVALLSALPGMIRADSLSAGELLRIRYNEVQLGRETILWQVERKGFAVVPQSSRRLDPLGARVVIPPNQAT
jgi:hypothetical protein